VENEEPLLERAHDTEPGSRYCFVVLHILFAYRQLTLFHCITAIPAVAQITWDQICGSFLFVAARAARDLITKKHYTGEYLAFERYGRKLVLDKHCHKYVIQNCLYKGACSTHLYVDCST